MHYLLQAVQVGEKNPGATRATFGTAIPVDCDFALPCPFLPSALESDDGLTYVTPRRRGTDGLPFASHRVMRWLYSRLPRHSLGAANHDKEGRPRRLAALHAFVEQVPADIRQEHAPFVVAAIGHFGMGALALRLEDVVEALGTRWDKSEAEAWILAAVEGGSFYTFDAVGQACDEQAARAKVEEKRAAERAEAERERVAAIEQELSKPSTRTLGELGFFAIEIQKGADVPVAVKSLFRYRTDDRDYALVAFSSGTVLHTNMPSGPIALGVKILDGSFVLPGTRKAVDALTPGAAPATFLQWLFEHVRPMLGVETSTPRTIEWDESTADGRYRVEVFESLISENEGAFPSRAPSVLASDWPSFDFPLRMLFEAGSRGLSLADDVVANILAKHIAENWARVHAKPVGRPHGPEKPRWADGELVPPCGGCLDCRGWDRYEERRAVEAKREGNKYTPKPWVVPTIYAWCATGEALLDAYRNNAGKPLFAVDELFVSPEPTVIDRVKDMLRIGDAWAPIVKAFVEAKDVVRSADIEAALREANALSTALATPHHQRVHRIMTALGWTKAERVVEGRRVKVWLRTPCAEKWGGK